MPIRVKIALVALAAFMVFGTVFMLSNSVTGEDASTARPDYVEAVIPTDRTQVLSQSTVGIDLKEGFEAYLIINGQAITNRASEEDPDGLEVSEDLGIFQYNPGPDRVVEALTAPEQCVTAMVWRTSDGQGSAKEITWCFGVT